MQYSLQHTQDGSSTLYLQELDECFHSSFGAVQESAHIFIKAGLESLPNIKTINILEMGFGTGLNAWLTIISNEKQKNIAYHAIEKYPLSENWIAQLNYPELFPEHAQDYHQLHHLPWDKWQTLTKNFSIKKEKQDIKTVTLPFNQYHLIYFDAFSPEKQSTLWTQEVFAKIYKAMQKGGIIVSYCAKGSIRRLWQEIGWKVERCPGPPGKREILRGVK